MANADPHEDERLEHHLGRSRELRNVGFITKCIYMWRIVKKNSNSDYRKIENMNHLDWIKLVPWDRPSRILPFCKIQKI